MDKAQPKRDRARVVLILTYPFLKIIRVVDFDFGKFRCVTSVIKAREGRNQEKRDCEKSMSYRCKCIFDRYHCLTFILLCP